MLESDIILCYEPVQIFFFFFLLIPLSLFSSVFFFLNFQIHSLKPIGIVKKIILVMVIIYNNDNTENAMFAKINLGLISSKKLILSHQIKAQTIFTRLR